MPKVFNKYHNNTPKDAVNIMRPSKWGNPIVLHRDGNRNEVLELYKIWLQNNPELILQAMIELKDKDVECCCAPRKCHGDILIQVANNGLYNNLISVEQEILDIEIIE